jgi:hypothetical protein
MRRDRREGQNENGENEEGIWKGEREREERQGTGKGKEVKGRKERIDRKEHIGRTISGVTFSARNTWSSWTSAT